MIRQTRQIKDGSLAGVAKIAALLSLTVTIFACDGANQGVQIGNGQTPDPVVIDFPIAFVKAPIPTDDNGVFEQTDLREQITSLSSQTRERFVRTAWEHVRAASESSRGLWPGLHRPPRMHLSDVRSTSCRAPRRWPGGDRSM